MPKVNAHTGGLGCLYTAITVSMMKAAPCTIHHADIAFFASVVALVCFIGICVFTILCVRAVRISCFPKNRDLLC